MDAALAANAAALNQVGEAVSSEEEDEDEDEDEEDDGSSGSPSA